MSFKLRMLRVDGEEQDVEKITSIYDLPIDTIDFPESMHSELKDAAMCKAAEALISQLVQMDERQMRKVNLLPQKIIRKLINIPLELVPLVSRRLARSFTIDKSNAQTTCVDCEINSVFFHYYSLNLFKYEKMSHAKKAYDWYLDNNFILKFDIALAKEQRLVAGIDDAIKQGNETLLQLQSVKAGFTVNELHSFFPRHVKTRFKELMIYCNDERTKGSACRVYDEGEVVEYRQNVEYYLKYTDNSLEAKLLAYNDMIQNDKDRHPITSYEQELYKSITS